LFKISAKKGFVFGSIEEQEVTIRLK